MPATTFDTGKRTTDCSGDHTVMAKQVRPWLAKPGTVAALRVQVSDGEPASRSHQGQRHAPQQKSGCTGAIYLCKPSERESLARLGASMYDRRLQPSCQQSRGDPERSSSFPDTGHCPAVKRTPIDRPLVKWRAKPRRRSVGIFTVVDHAHPVFRSLGCTSMADAHQTPIWIRYGRIARQGATASALG